MKKEQILVRDNKGFFLKMFKRKFKAEFDFLENSFLHKDQDNYNETDHFIYVVYDKFELIEFFKLDKKEINILVCIFNKQLYDSLTILAEINNFFFLDGSKNRREIIKELQIYFQRPASFKPKASCDPLVCNPCKPYIFFSTCFVRMLSRSSYF